MPLIRSEVAKEPVKIFAFPPATDHFVSRWYDFVDSFVEGNRAVGFDVETTAIDGDVGGAFDPNARLRTIQFGSPTEAWVFGMESKIGNENYVDTESLCVEFWLDKIIDFLSGPHDFVSHSDYDVLWVERELNVTFDNRSLDTLPMASLLFPSDRGGNDLKSLASRFIDGGLVEAETVMLKRFKQLAPVGQRTPAKVKAWGFTNIPLQDKAFLAYAGLDAIYVSRLLPILENMLHPKMLTLSDREQRVQRIMTKTRQRGQRLDLEYTRNLLDEIDGEFTAVENRLRERLNFSPRSPRLGQWFAERGMQFSELTPHGAPRLDKDTLPLLASRYKTHEVFGPILDDKVELSSKSNLRSNLKQILAATYGTEYVHPRINIAAALTGRMSIVNPAMQTFKKRDKRLRGCFITRPGFLFISCDYASQETRLAAAFSSDPAMVEIVTTPDASMHKMTARLIFGDSYTPEQYDVAKVLDFAQQYGAGPKTIAGQLGVPIAEATRLWKKWRKAYKQFVQWSEYVARYDTVVNPWGREIPSDPRRRYANGNYAIQSSGRDLLGDAIINTDKIGLSKYIWLPIHDEIVLEVPEDVVGRAARALERCMFAKLGDIEFPASAEILGTRWNGES